MSAAGGGRDAQEALQLGIRMISEAFADQRSHLLRENERLKRIASEQLQALQTASQESRMMRQRIAELEREARNKDDKWQSLVEARNAAVSKYNTLKKYAADLQNFKKSITTVVSTDHVVALSPSPTRTIPAHLPPKTPAFDTHELDRLLAEDYLHPTQPTGATGSISGAISGTTRNTPSPLRGYSATTHATHAHAHAAGPHAHSHLPVPAGSSPDAIRSFSAPRPASVSPSPLRNNTTHHSTSTTRNGNGNGQSSGNGHGHGNGNGNGSPGLLIDDRINPLAFYGQVREVLDPNEYNQFAQQIRSLNSGVQSPEATLQQIQSIFGNNRPFLFSQAEKLVQQAQQDAWAAGPVQE